MVNKIISYMNYCRIKDELQESIDKDLKYYGLDKKSRSGLRVVYIVDRINRTKCLWVLVLES